MKTPPPTIPEDDEVCICGYKFKEHQRVNLKKVDSDLDIIYVCPDNESGLMPSVFIKPCCKRTKDQERSRLLTKIEEILLDWDDGKITQGQASELLWKIIKNGKE